MNAIIIIPARFASSRLPGKMLSELGGRPVIWHTWQKALACGAAQVLVATDHEAIAEVIRDGGGEALMTGSGCRNGAERVAHACRMLGLPQDAIVVNLQGDEPGMPPEAIAAAVAALEEESDCAMSTLAVPLLDEEEARDPHVVKVVCNARGRAMYFSRSLIPASHDGKPWPRMRHVGLYAYRVSALLHLSSLPPAPIEEAESLEQLRALWHGMAIAVAMAPAPIIRGIDTPEDLERWRAMLQNQPPCP